MKRKLGTIGQTDLRMHPATAIWLVLSLLGPRRVMWCWGIASVLLHEGAHTLMAYLLHTPPQEVEITPLGALMRLDEEETLPCGKRVAIILAGPCMSLLLCVLAFFLTKWSVLALPLGKGMFLANAGLLMVNLLPALPLDGGRLLSALLGHFFRRETCWRVMRILGTVLGAGLVVLGAMLSFGQGNANWSLSLAGCFLLYSATSATTTRAMAELQDFMDRRIRLEEKGILAGQVLMALETQSLRQAVCHLHPARMSIFCVLQMGNMACLGMLSEQQVIAAYLDRPQQSMGECLQQEEKHDAIEPEGRAAGRDFANGRHKGHATPSAGHGTDAGQPGAADWHGTAGRSDDSAGTRRAHFTAQGAGKAN